MKGLRLKIALLAIIISFATLATIVLGINLINYNVVIGESDRTLNRLSEAPEHIGNIGGTTEPPISGALLPGIRPNQFESRYFVIIYDGDDVTANLSAIGNIDEDTAISYANIARTRGVERGFISSYRYLVDSSRDTTKVFMLDVGRRLTDFYSFLYTSIGVSLFAMAILALISFALAARIARPIEEANQRQKRFITDASHELKTPIAIINANVGLLKDEIGENESLSDIEEQTKRLKSLTEELVYLARLDEDREGRTLYLLPLSEVVEDTAHVFLPLAEDGGRALDISVDSDISINGITENIEKLVSILLDNAIKYSTAGSAISLTLKKTQTEALLTVTNQVDSTLGREALSHIFDRFWRADDSRSGAVGYGVGLSIADAIVKSHNGRIQASEEASTFIITVSLPIAKI